MQSYINQLALRTRTLIVLASLLLLATTSSPCGAKPTREQIIAFAESCKIKESRMDLVAEFGTDFSGLDLHGMDFRGYYHVGNETLLRHANFSNCNLRQAEFGSAVLDDADFTGANLDHAVFVTASLKRAILLQANFHGTRFQESDLSGAKLMHADLSSADITGSRFGGADLSDANLVGAKNDYGWTDFTRANMTRANLAGLKLNGACFQDAVVRGADLSGAQLIQADFAGADLTDASFRDARVESAIFRNVRGLSDLQKQQLETQAQRWKFELKTSFSAFLAAMRFPIYALVVGLLAAFSLRALRFPDRKRSTVCAGVVNLLTLIPACALLGMGLLGASSTAQFNAGDAGAMHLWSTWVHLWPLFMLLLLACLAVAAGTALVFLATHWRWNALKRTKLALAYVVLTVVHCLFALYWVGGNFPDA